MVSGDWGGIGEAIKKELKEVISPDALYKRSTFLDQEQANLRATLGLGTQKADEFRKLVADGAASFAQIGLSVDKVRENYEGLISVFQTNIATSDQDLFEIAATAKVTGQSTKELAGGFRSVGISLKETGERMTEVAEIARQAGVSVAGVSDGVLKNIEKMNLYNFENGTRGLAKMAAQASRLGIDMDKIFVVVDKAFNPESAIEMAAAMQRLGVSTGALLDPLRLMDLSQNDPTELQNQIVNMTKDFVRFNEELGQFEIMPGEKRRLNEIGKELGMTNGELQRMALNAASLDMKMKQIRFPSSLASKEDRELIATLATVNKQGVAEIKVALTDDKGERTGEYDMVEVSELTNEQLENIKKDQELRGRTMEEIAGDQLSELAKLNTQFDSIKKAISYGAATSRPVSAIYEASTTGLRSNLFGDKALGEEGMVKEMYKETETYRTFVNDIGIDDIKELGGALKGDFGGAIDYITNAISGVDWSSISSGLGSVVDTIKSVPTMVSEYTNFGIGGAGDISVTDKNLKAKGVKELNMNENINVDINVKLDPNIQNQALNEIIQQQVEQWFKGSNSNNNLSIVHNQLKTYRTSNGLIAE